MNTAIVNASNALSELEEEIEFLKRQLERGETSKSNYDDKIDEKLQQREKIILTTPQFWLRVLISHPTTGAHITASDCQRLRSLRNIQCVHHQGNDFDIVFEFGKNDYFGDSQFVKSFRIHQHFGLLVNPISINWKPDMKPNLEVEVNSFFNWFQSNFDHRLFGELFRDEILPNAIPLFHGSWHPNDDFFDDSDSDTTTASTVSGC